jgi:hypothetical protein
MTLGPSRMKHVCRRASPSRSMPRSWTFDSTARRTSTPSTTTFGGLVEVTARLAQDRYSGVEQFGRLGQKSEPILCGYVGVMQPGSFEGLGELSGQGGKLGAVGVADLGQDLEGFAIRAPSASTPCRRTPRATSASVSAPAKAAVPACHGGEVTPSRPG